MTIKRQLSILFLVGIVVLAGTLSLVNHRIASRMLRADEIQKWNTIGEGIVNHAWLALALDSKSAGQEILNQLTAYPGVTFAALVNQAGQPLAIQGHPADCGNFDSIAPEPNKVSSLTVSNLWCFEIAVHKQKGSVTPFDLNPTENDTARGSLQFAVSQAATNALIDRIVWFNTVAALLIAAIIYIGVLMITRRMTQPLETLAATLRNAEQGDTKTRAVVGGSSEISEMQQAFNQMMDQLELQANSLESEVELRTHELSQARDAATSSARFKSQLLAVISHEMRTPLHGIIGFLQIAQEELQKEHGDNPHAIDPWLVKISASGQQLLDQINQLLMYSRIESGKTAVTLSECSPHELIEKATDIIAPLAEKNDNTLTVNNPHLGTIKTDAEKLLQIILNLLVNANKFTQKGHIEISSTLFSDHYRVTIEDTGCGIPQDQLSLIFEPFVQADMSETRTHDGTGLGLAIAQQFATLLGGRIEVNSKLDSGTQFRVDLPINPNT